jgi:hypothetical protein
MVLVEVHSWVRFFAGMLAGSWIGAVVACAGVLLLVGRRVRQLELINSRLRIRLKARSKSRRTGTVAGGGGSMLVMPLPGAHRKSEKPVSRIAQIN